MMGSGMRGAGGFLGLSALTPRTLPAEGPGLLRSYRARGSCRAVFPGCFRDPGVCPVGVRGSGEYRAKFWSGGSPADRKPGLKHSVRSRSIWTVTAFVILPLYTTPMYTSNQAINMRIKIFSLKEKCCVGESPVSFCFFLLCFQLG